MNIIAIIPARYASTRLPGKPLALVNGKPMIRRVYEQVAKVFEHVCVATDDERIFNAVSAFGGKAVMTSCSHKTGTDRCFEALQIFSKEHNVNFDIVINVQGDEPYIQPEQLKMLADCFASDDIEIATLVKKIKSKEEFLNPNAIKVVMDNKLFALYFSRAPIPYPRDEELTDDFISSSQLFKHIGLYGYRCSTLKEIHMLQSGTLEKTEKLEQLRWLEHGYRIKVAETCLETWSIDTAEDLEYVNSKFCKI